jgi:hypothetical protein
MKKAFEITKMTVFAIKAFVEYQIFHKNSQEEL